MFRMGVKWIYLRVYFEVAMYMCCGVLGQVIKWSE